jgi:hypothetical protein
MKHTVSRFSALAVFLACLAVLCLTMVPGPAEAKNRTTSEILTEVTAQPDGFFDVQLGDSEATFRKRMVNKRKEWRLLKDTSQQVQLDRVVPVSTKPVEKPVEGRVFAILHAGKIQRLEYVFMTDDATAADRLMRTGASKPDEAPRGAAEQRAVGADLHDGQETGSVPVYHVRLGTG